MARRTYTGPTSERGHRKPLEKPATYREPVHASLAQILFGRAILLHHETIAAQTAVCRRHQRELSITEIMFDVTPSLRTFEWKEHVFTDAFGVDVESAASCTRKHVVFLLADHARVIHSRLCGNRLLLLLHEKMGCCWRHRHPVRLLLLLPLHVHSVHGLHGLALKRRVLLLVRHHRLLLLKRHHLRPRLHFHGPS